MNIPSTASAVAKHLTIFHFNDVYNIEPANIEPLGGAARLMTACQSIQDKNPIVLFSGDCLNPSMISSVEKGNQMLPVLNGIGVNCAVLGNHEFDFGLQVLEEFMSKCSFPWLLSNVLDKCTGKPIAGANETFVLNWEGVTIGFIGLAEEDWLVTLPTLDITDMIFTDYVESATYLSKRLREQGADLVIALTHMRLKNDLNLLKEVASIDIVFGGHDHHYCVEQVDSRYVVKSGSDFQNASIVTLKLTADNTLHSVGIEEVTLDSSVAEDETMRDVVNCYMENFGEMTKAVIGYIDSDLDGMFEHIRAKETNLGNLIADVMVNFTGADLAIINSGTFRSNCIHPKGPFTNKDLLRILPLFDQLCVLEMSGQTLHLALENGVSNYPKLDGRFPQVSGVTFEFKPQKEPGERIHVGGILVNGAPLQYDNNYSVCVKEYIASGKDGYSVMRGCPAIINADAGLVLSTSVQNFFEGTIRPCKSKGCLHSHCNPASDERKLSIVSHHQKSHTGNLCLVPQVEGRIKILKSSATDINGNL